MKVRALYDGLTQQGVILTAEGDRLVVDGPRSVLTDDVIERLMLIKADLLGLLERSHSSESWDADDWQAYFRERAAIREIGGRLSRAEAERLAFEDAMTQWMALNPAPSTDVRQGCAYCGSCERPADPLLPVLAPHHGHIWVHDRCHAAWKKARRAEARQVLQTFGLNVGTETIASVVQAASHSPPAR